MAAYSGVANYQPPCTWRTLVQAEGSICAASTDDDVIKDGDKNQVIINCQNEGGEFSIENWDE